MKSCAAGQGPACRPGPLLLVPVSQATSASPPGQRTVPELRRMGAGAALECPQRCLCPPASALPARYPGHANASHPDESTGPLCAAPAALSVPTPVPVPLSDLVRAGREPSLDIPGETSPFWAPAPRTPRAKVTFTSSEPTGHTYRPICREAESTREAQARTLERISGKAGPSFGVPCERQNFSEFT